MAELRDRLRPKVDLTRRMTAGEALPQAGKSKLKQYSVYLHPDHMKWLKQRALEPLDGEDINVSRLLDKILSDAIASKRYDTEEA
ncbi:hypothetical protein 40AC_39 [Mycobacterium phage 40AC]|uniref:Uncharacterized protein n=1 Tax=Mycobacterium phage 40AC TaxID=1458717 RepID=W8EAJ9_9CAUD|nr:hypothetical protein ST40AC_39 [Mycobacterium phage 40AC]AHJ86403.1 hypothetical protein 40AC_39 [Mycobacterium phage 40AC]